MRIQCWHPILILILLTTFSSAGLGTIIEVEQSSENELIISVDQKIHLDYGLAYPLTYKINIPSAITNLKVYTKKRATDPWFALEEKTSNDFF